MPTTAPLSPFVATLRSTLSGKPPEASGIAADALREYDALERPDKDARQLKKLTLLLSTGFCLAVFPSTPGLVANCQADHNAGWLCGARIASFIAGVGAATIGLEAGLSLWWGRGYQQQQSERLGVQLGAQLGGGAQALSAGESILHLYQGASAADRTAAVAALDSDRLGC